MTNNLLHFTDIHIEYDGSEITLPENIRCPKCKQVPQNIANKTWNCNLNKSLDFNGQTTFTLSCCGTQITLNIAVHKEKYLPPAVCIARPEIEIPLEWWI